MSSRSTAPATPGPSNPAVRNYSRPFNPGPSVPAVAGPAAPAVPNFSRPFKSNNLPEWPQLGTPAAEELAQVRKQVADAAHGEGDATGYDKAFAAADIIALAIDAGTNGAHHVYTASQGMQTLARGFGTRRKTSNVKVRANPWFLANGHDEGQSPVTQTYLRNREWKTFAGAAVSFAGNLGELAPTAGVNVSGTLQHISAAVSTGGHLLGIRAIAQSSKKTVTIARWCDAIIKMKNFKLATRGLQIAADVIPVPIADQVVNIAAAAANLGYKIKLAELCYITAMEIHWRAFQEQTISNLGPMRHVIDGNPRKRSRGVRIGPASRIFAEIFVRRGLTAGLGSYDVESLIREPAGWMALGDKLVQA
jgi:hypothetical protein